MTKDHQCKKNQKQHYWLGSTVLVSELVIKKHAGRNGDTESCSQRTSLYLSIYVLDKATEYGI